MRRPTRPLGLRAAALAALGAALMTLGACGRASDKGASPQMEPSAAVGASAPASTVAAAETVTLEEEERTAREARSDLARRSLEDLPMGGDGAADGKPMPPPADPEPFAPAKPSAEPSPTLVEPPEATALPAEPSGSAGKVGKPVIALDAIAIEGRLSGPEAAAAMAGGDVGGLGLRGSGTGGGGEDLGLLGGTRGEGDLEAKDRPADLQPRAKGDDSTHDGELENRDGFVDADSADDAKKQELKEVRDERRPASGPREKVDALALGQHTIRLAKDGRDDALTFVRPDRVLPRMFYFENTYLGGSAAYRERLLRLDAALAEGERPYRLAFGGTQPLDPPTTSGLEVTAELDAPYFAEPRRVFLQVGLRGSARYGWRRPPLDVVLVVDGPALSGSPDAVTELVVAVLAELGPADRLGIVVAADEPLVFTALNRLERARARLAATLDELPAAAPRGDDPGRLARAMVRAGEVLAEASTDTAIVPGTQTVLVVTAGDEPDRVAAAAQTAHGLTVQGAVTSVFALDRTPERGGWWQVANAGHGNFHHLGDASTRDLVAWELESLARVVARLVRVNIRLGKSASAIRVLGTRVLDEEEVAQVKAREEATDKNLSRALGITSDRGEDDDGIQTVIPYFYGDDSHVILVELWVEGPGPIADVTVKYKDMVNLGNATGRTAVRLESRPRPETPQSDLIARNVAGFEMAEALQRASLRVRRGDREGAEAQLALARARAERTGPRDRSVVEGFARMVGDERWTWDEGRRATVSESLKLAGERKVGEPRP